MKKIISAIVLASILIIIFILGNNAINNCQVDENGLSTVSECIDATLINSILVSIGVIGITYIAIMVYRFDKPLDHNEKMKLADDYYNYWDSKSKKKLENGK